MYGIGIEINLNWDNKENVEQRRGTVKEVAVSRKRVLMDVLAVAVEKRGVTA